MASTPPPPAQPPLPQSAPHRGKAKIFTSSQPELPAHPSIMDPTTTSLTPQSERPARSSSLQRSFTFESPNGLTPTSVGPSTRRRSRAGFAASYDGAADDEQESKEKGGHSLRKRTRIDYTQEVVDDDSSAQDPKSGAVKKTAPTPAVLSRKRRTTQDLSGNESEDANGGTKRRRVEKEVSGPKAITSTRRKTPARKLPHADPQPLVEQSSSDNDVQDTIMVGVSIEDLYLAESQDSSSPNLSYSHPSPSSHYGSSPPPSPGVTGHEMEQPPPEVLEAPDRADKPEESNHASTQVGGPPFTQQDTATASEIQLPDLPTVDDLKKDQVTKTEAADLAQEETRAQVQIGQAGVEHDMAPATATEEVVPSSEALPVASLSTENVASSSQDERIDSIESSDPDGKEGHDPSLSAPATTSQQPAETLQPEKTGPKTLPQLKPIYTAAEEGPYYGPLKPYEDEEVVHPVSWTEVVHPGEKAVPTPTPAATPAPTPPPRKAPVFSRRTWDPIKLPTFKVFFAMYKEDMDQRKARGEKPFTMWEYRKIVGDRHRAALAKQKKRRDNLTPVEAVSDVVATTKKGKGRKGKHIKTKAAPVKTESPVLETPHVSPAPESQQPTAAPTPEPVEEINQDEPPLAAEEDEQDAEHDLEPELNQPDAQREGPLVPEVITKIPKRQYSFRKLPDIAGFEEQLADPQDQDNEALYEKLAASAETIKAWQNEFNELRKITDDEDNAKRRLQNDKTTENWDARQKLDEAPIWRRTFTDVLAKVPPFFEVKGVRAPKPYVDDPEEEHQRQEDMIMAQAYGFNHDNDRRHIGKQNPEAQRWDMSENRLRERKQTKKAADAVEEGVIVEGKRTRKPRVLGDQSVQPSRAPTPVPITRPRRKRAGYVEEQAAEEEQHEAPADVAAVQKAEPAPEPQPATRKRGPRGKAKADASTAAKTSEAPAMPAPVHEDGKPNGVHNLLPDEKAEDKPKVTRKRVRAAAPHPLATASFPEPKQDVPVQEEASELQPPKAKRQRRTKAQPAASTTPVDNEIPSTSFYGQPIQQPTTHDREQSRPSTSSSNGTAHTAATVESAYSLRDKKPRNFAEENDPALGSRKRAKPAADVDEVQEPAKKRVRVVKKPRIKLVAVPDTKTEPALPSFVEAPAQPDNHAPPPAPAQGHMMHIFNAHPDPPAASKPLKKPKIRIIYKEGTTNGNGNGNSNHTAAGPSQQSTPAPEDGAPTPLEGSENGSLEPEKPYSEMSKSEKMSFSMKRKLSQCCFFFSSPVAEVLLTYLSQDAGPRARWLALLKSARTRWRRRPRPRQRPHLPTSPQSRSSPASPRPVCPPSGLLLLSRAAQCHHQPLRATLLPSSRVNLCPFLNTSSITHIIILLHHHITQT